MLGAVLALLLVSTLGPGSWRPTRRSHAGTMRIVVLSNRADLISAGDALVEIVLADGTDPGALQVEVAGATSPVRSPCAGQARWRGA